MGSVLLSYERLRDEITSKIDAYRSKIDRGDLTTEELKSLLADLLKERELIVEEIDELREPRYGWISDAYRYMNTMKLRLSELDETTYNSLESLAGRLNLDVGSLLNEMMGKIVDKKDTVQGAFPNISSRDLSHLWKKREGTVNISHYEDVTITQSDLEELDSRVKFSHINNLEFDPSVQEKTFQEKVKSINHCRTIRFPKDFSKLLVYAKSNYCKFFEFAR